MAEPFEQDQTSFAGLKPDTADTGFENVRTAQTDIQESEATEPDEFDAADQEPTGFREVELDNGDIVMEPYWDDNDEDTDTGSKLA